MKFVFFGYDFSYGVIARLIEDGHEPLAIFSFETDGIFSFNIKTRELAQKHQIPFSDKAVGLADIAGFLDQGCKLFISAGYPHKIPPIDENDAYAINFHPTLLPQGRGIMPMPWLFLKYPQHAGITIHKIAPKFDSGDIIYQEAMIISDQDDIDTLCARLAMRMPVVIADIVKNIKTYWAVAQPQEEPGSWWQPPSIHDRNFDWAKPIQHQKNMIRAFGRFGMLAEINAMRYSVFHAKAWIENHDFEPGSVACHLSREIVMAVPDGFVMLKEFEKIQG